jgi:hypothetical protein
MNIRVDFAYLVGRKLTNDLEKQIQVVAGDGLLRVHNEGEPEGNRTNRNRVNLTINSGSYITDVWMG